MLNLMNGPLSVIVHHEIQKNMVKTKYKFKENSIENFFA